MARVTIELPDELPFATEIDVRVTDMNYGSHLGNDSMLSLIHEARVRFLAAHGLNEREIEGTALILADAAVAYRAEAFAGDRLRFEVGIGDLGRVACDLLYRAVRVQDDRLVAEAKTGLVFVDPTTRRPVPLPVAIRQLRNDSN